MSDTPSPQPNVTPEPAPPAPEPTFTQSDLDAIAAKRARTATKAAEAKIADQLGVPVDEAARIIADAAAAEQENMTEAERARTAAEAAQAEAVALRTQAAADRTAARLERALSQAGMKPEAVTRMAPTISLDADADDSDVVAAVDALRTDLPDLFTTSPASPAPSSTPTGPRREKPAPPTASLAAGAEAAAKKYGDSKQPTFTP